MSKKVAEPCPKCGTSTMPTDKCMMYCGNVPLRTWRFECECGWVWANDLQRKHNGPEFQKMYKAINHPMY